MYYRRLFHQGVFWDEFDFRYFGDSTMDSDWDVGQAEFNRGDLSIAATGAVRRPQDIDLYPVSLQYTDSAVFVEVSTKG